MREYDDAVLECFLDKQLQLFPEAVAETLDEAEDFLEECMAVVVDSVDDVIEYFDEAGMDRWTACPSSPIPPEYSAF